MAPTTVPTARSLPVIQPAPRPAVLVDQLARQMRSAAEQAIAPHGLRPRHVVALTVLRDQGESTQQALSELLQIDRTNLVGLLNELEEERLIERRRSEADRRRHIVRLTATGARRLVRVERSLAAVEEQALRALDDEQREQLGALLLLATGGGPGAHVCTEAAADDARGANDPAC